LGYVAGQILAESEDLNISSDLINALHRVQECLGLEVFSVDIFINQGGAFYIVDVDPAPAFSRNAKARQNFAIYIQLIGKLYLE
jgi:glutathione synthase/RimK-type ligase-like ATP-grasp enzyme